MDITVVKSAGFCFGVKKAVDKVYELIADGEKIAVLGELIHNPHVIADLKSHGVMTIDDVSECPDDAVLVIRTHGVGKNITDEAEKVSKKLFDLTCPYVQKIHDIVHKHSTDGYKIIIVGDAKHPEVLGIKGWSVNDAVIVNSCDEAEKCNFDKACVVAQTTINKENFEKIIKILKNNCKEVLIFDTICKSTKTRQCEAEEISTVSDVMFVIGGKDSSNTRKLYEICKKNCPNTFHIENFEGLPQNIDYKNIKIGITAGASTPSGIIEEVVRTMEENKTMGELNFAEEMEKTLKPLNTGDVVTGIVADVSPTEVIVDLGTKSDGIIAASELSDDPDVKPSDIVKVGDEIEVFVVGVNDGEGKTILSKKKLDAIAGQKKLEEALENGTIVTGKVTQVVNGGIIVLIEGASVFVPARFVSDRYVEDLSVFLNQTVSLKLTEMNQRRRRMTGNIREVLVEQKKALSEQFWAEAEAGKKYTGIVKSIMPFGAFVDIGGVDGLVHISELSWTRIKTPADVLNIGDSVEVYIKDINADTKKISLGFKKAEDNPWVIAQNKFNVGDVVTAKVVRFMDFGAFVELIPGVDGLIHVSQIALERIDKPSSVLKIGQSVQAKITDLNWDTKRISLSMKALLEPEAPAEEVTEEAPVEE